MSSLTPEALDTIEAIVEILNRGNVVYRWPDDEAAAYRDNGGFAEGNAAVDAIRAQKIISLVYNMHESELRRLRTENEEQGRKIAAALLASRDSRYPASSFDIIVALTGEATE